MSNSHNVAMLVVSLIATSCACSVSRTNVDASVASDIDSQSDMDGAQLPEGAIELTTRPVRLGYHTALWDGQAFTVLWLELGGGDPEHVLQVARISTDGELLTPPRRLLSINDARYMHAFWNKSGIVLWWVHDGRINAATIAADLQSADGPRRFGEALKVSVAAVPDGYDLLLNTGHLYFQRFSSDLISQGEPELVKYSSEGILFWDAPKQDHIVLYKENSKTRYYRGRIDPKNVAELKGSILVDTGKDQKGARIYGAADDRVLYLWQENTATALVFEEDGKRLWGPKYLAPTNRVINNALSVAERQNQLWLAWTSDLEQVSQVQVGWDPTASDGDAKLRDITTVSRAPQAFAPVLAAGGEALALLFVSVFDGSEHLLLHFIQ